MIYGFAGQTGAGKTNSAVKLLYKLWKKGNIIHTNIPLFFSENNERIFEYQDVAELYNVKNAVIFMDEAQILLDAYEWQGMSKSFRYKLTQHRKQGLDLICTFQAIGSVHIKLRQLIHDLTLCEKIFRFPFNDRKLALFQIYRTNQVRFKEGDNDAKHIVEKTKTRIKLIHKWQNILYDTNSQVGLHRYNMVCTITKKGTKITIK